MWKYRQVREKLSHPQFFLALTPSLYLTCRRDHYKFKNNFGKSRFASLLVQDAKVTWFLEEWKELFDLGVYFNLISFQNFGIQVSFKILSARNLASIIVSCELWNIPSLWLADRWNITPPVRLNSRFSGCMLAYSRVLAIFHLLPWKKMGSLEIRTHASASDPVLSLLAHFSHVKDFAVNTHACHSDHDVTTTTLTDVNAGLVWIPLANIVNNLCVCIIQLWTKLGIT